jgi:hypothetical protein
MAKLVKVKWLDAFGEVDKTIFNEYEISHEPLILESVGWVLREDDTGITIAMDCNPKEDFSFRNVGFIPRQMILEVSSLYSRKKKDRKD